jgi:small subunit ribosomal protein S16
MIVQDSRRTPTSGNIVALIGHYDPHSKTTTIDKDKVTLYLSNGAQPSDRVIRILKQEKIKLPSWVKQTPKKSTPVKHQDKLRRNRPPEAAKAEPEAASPAAEPTPEPIEAESLAETPAEPNEAAVTPEASVEAETPAEAETETIPTAETPAEAEAAEPETEPDKPAETKS